MDREIIVKMINHPNYRPLFQAAWVLILFLLLTILACPAAAREATRTSEPDYQKLLDSLDETIQKEQTDLQELKNRHRQLQHTQKAVLTEINAYKVQISTHGNLLHLQNTGLRLLEQARSDNHVATENVESRIKTLKQNTAAIKNDLLELEGQIRINKDQFDSLTTVNLDGDDTEAAVPHLEQLLDVLVAKQDLMNEIHGVYTTFLGQFEDINAILEELSQDFDQKIANRKKQFLLTRNQTNLLLLNKDDFRGEIDQLKNRMQNLSKRETWVKELRTDWKSGQSLLLSLLIIYMIIQFLLMRLKGFLTRCLSNEKGPQAGYQAIALRVIIESLYVFGLTGFAYLYSTFTGIYSTIPFIKLIIQLLTVVLFTKWFHSFLNLWLSNYSWIKTGQVRKLVHLVIFIRYFSLIYLAFSWLLESDAMLLYATRLILEAGLVIWLITFWKENRGTHPAPEKRSDKMTTVVSFISNGIVIAGVMLELSGYSGLAVLWYRSWATSTVVLLWSGILFLVLREWRHLTRAKIAEHDDGHPNPALLFRWAGLQVGWIVWLISTIVFLIAAWGGKKVILFSFLKAANREVALGSIRISLLNLLYALLVLILTQAIAKFWRYVLKDKILSGSGLNTGLQNSITMISVYSLWAFGILLSLHVFGFGTTSLAVGFGALGKGKRYRYRLSAAGCAPYSRQRQYPP